MMISIFDEELHNNVLWKFVVKTKVKKVFHIHCSKTAFTLKDCKDSFAERFAYIAPAFFYSVLQNFLK